MAALCLISAATAAAATAATARAATGATGAWRTLSDPIDPAQLTDLGDGQSSQMLQPWRSSLTTRPATALQDAIGINFNVTPSEADATARLLADSGVHRVRLEIGWSEMSDSDPSQLADPAAWATDIQAFRQYGLRPLILLNANSGMPGPGLSFALTLTAPAPAGATTVELDAGSAAAVVPGLTGIDSVDAAGNPMAAGVLITSVSGDGVATLSRPLPAGLAAGAVPATTLRYAPFAKPQLSDGSPNPRFAQTMAGWLQYVQAVCDFVRGQYGSDDFDVEVWNELSFGSAFLDESNYFSPVPDPGATGNTDDAILAGTVAILSDPANGLTDVRIGDGFANQTPFVSGASEPAGVAAIDKHLYQGPVGYAGYGRMFMPEYFLTGVPSAPVIRDLSPIQTSLDGVAHGAGTHPAGGAPPALWITEANLDADTAQGNGMPAADIPEFQAKAALRYYTAYASEGAQAIDLYAASWPPDDAGWGLIPRSFFAAVDADPSGYPGDGAGGLTMRALARMSFTLAGAQPIADPRALRLDAVSSDSVATQFGNGESGRPTLPNRDVLAFFPFQVSAHRFVSSVYVMTRDLTHDYGPDPEPGQTSYDLPPESFRLTIGGVDAAQATVSLLDPLTGAQRPATIVARVGSRIVVSLAVTDSPQMLTIDDSPSNALARSATAGADPRPRSCANRRRSPGHAADPDHGCRRRLAARPSPGPPGRGRARRARERHPVADARLTARQSSVQRPGGRLP
ncbi:MAG: hypothetical protein ABSH51_02300 [Solirubrobacteraceae bacterium]